MVLTSSYGTIFNATSTPEIEFIEHFKADISSFNKNKLSVVAFITYTGSTSTDHEVLNAQRCDIDGFQDWD